jgi:YesN/AraC family two-component response regulator
VGVNSNYHDRILILLPADEIGPLLSQYGNIDLDSFFSKSYGIIDLNEAGQKYVEGLLFFIIREMKMKHSNYDFMVRMKLAELIIYGMRCNSGENAILLNAPVQTEKYKKISEIAKYINENYHDNISLADIARDFYISKCYLSRIFREITGFTVNEYINITRIKKAQQLLEQSDLNITEIADSIGYESITYFEKVFKKYLETSPLKYRKRFMKKS